MVGEGKGVVGVGVCVWVAPVVVGTLWGEAVTPTDWSDLFPARS